MAAELGDLLVEAWRRAERELGLTFTSPWHLVSPDQRRVTYLGLVHGFGGTRGTLVRVLQLGEVSGDEMIDDEFLVAKLGTRHSSFDRWLFVETLRQWGWRGPPQNRPEWLG